VSSLNCFERRTRAAIYIAMLIGLNVYFVQNLFRVDFTDNMQNNAGTFMAISRFIVEHWPHLNWYPWWFNGEPFENTYSPMLHMIDAAFAALFHCSTPRAFNFVTGLFYVTGPAFLFLFAWRVSKHLETSFFAALFYSLFSPAVLFHAFRGDLGSWWSAWRLRVLVYYGEGPHTVVLAMLPVALLFVYLAFTKRKYIWYVAAGLTMAVVALVNAFGAMDLGFGCACLILAMRDRKQMLHATLITAGIAVMAYLLASGFITPTLARTIMTDSQNVGDHYGARLFGPLALIFLMLVCLSFAAQRIPDYFTRFSLLFAFVFFAIVAFYELANVPALPQPHRYALEMEPALALALVFCSRPVVLRMKPWMRVIALAAMVLFVIHQTRHFRHYARFFTQKLDVTQRIEYKTAQWMNQNLPGQRAFVGAETGLWLNVFADTPQMNSGHDPFNPNFAVMEMAVYHIYSGEGAGAHDAQDSILWLKAFGCQAIYVPGPKSQVYTKPFQHPYKFQGVLPVLWHEEDDTIYALPQRTKSIAHVVPEGALVEHQPVNGLDTPELSRYVAALDDPALPDAPLTWRSTASAHIQTTLHPGQVISLQQTFDKGWIAAANGRPAKVTRDGLGLTVIHAGCDGQCEVELSFDGGLERKLFRAVSWTVAIAALAGFWIPRRRRDLAKSA
jgi:hypothetical protein